MSQSTGQCNHVFVYGSLKRGEYNHKWLGRSTFIKRARLAGAEMYSMGAYPMVILKGMRSSVVHGEVFQLDAAGLDRLDVLEGYPSLYDRKVLTLSDGSQAWVYYGTEDQVQGHRRISLGDWQSTPVFSYGSNMNHVQLRRRCPHWDGSGMVARLDGWRWGIVKQANESYDEGYAGIIPDPDSHCWGVVNHLSIEDRRKLDRSEGVGWGHYRHEQVIVNCVGGEALKVLAYVPETEVLSDDLCASRDYAERILAGADYWQLGNDWCNVLRASLMMTT